jgi:hypothetical protein
VSIAAGESRQRKFRARQRSYRGARRNLFDLRRAATIQNLEGLQRLMRDAA